MKLRGKVFTISQEHLMEYNSKLKRGNLGYSEPTIDSVKDYEELISDFKRKIELLKEIIEDLKLGRPFHQRFEQNHNEMIEEKK